MLHLLLLVAIALAGFSLPAAAGQLTFGAGAEAVYDDNLFDAPKDAPSFSRVQKEEDISVVLRPGFRLEGQDGDVRWTSYYRPNVEAYQSLDIPTRWEHLVGGEVQWQLGARTHLTVSDDFKYLQSVSLDTVDVVGLSPAAFTQQLTKLNDLSIALRRILSPTRMLQFDLGQYWQDQQFGPSTNYLRGGARYNWTLSAWDVLGVGGNLSYQEIKRKVSALDDQKTGILNVSGSWRHEFDPSFSLELSAGPAFLNRNNPEVAGPISIVGRPYPVVPEGTEGPFFLVDGNSCSSLSTDCATLGDPLEGIYRDLLRSQRTTIPPDGSQVEVEDANVTVFATASLNKRWDQFGALLNFTRQESPSSGFGTSTISDTLFGSLSWNPARRWTVQLQTNIVRYSQATEGARLVVGLEPVPCPLPNINGNCDVTLVVPAGGSSISVASEVPPGTAKTTTLQTESVDSSSAILDTSIRLMAEYQLTERTRLFGRLTYFDQRGLNQAETTVQEFDRFRAVIGVYYEFLPLNVF